ncbi:unnamed protein product [Prorocentrum cordatum]|uniref:Pentatricopeptide repeat-containing protein n=1 Tax=Prorocentrum cordatum TaxID=2364126 RepID=A0ABN9VHK8_9DINO|nr:unnamed protein product [Polarella glacialis]
MLLLWSSFVRTSRRTVETGAVVAERDAGEATFEPGVVGYGAGIRASGRGKQWQRALSLFAQARGTGLELDTAIYNASIFACTTQHGQWRRALCLLGEMWEAMMEPDAIDSARSCSSQRVRGWGRRRQARVDTLTAMYATAM